MNTQPDAGPRPSSTGQPAADRPWRQLVLISSHRRSGSTWLAAVLGEAGEARLIPYEPLWLKWHKDSPYIPEIQEWRSRRGWHIGWDAESSQDLKDSNLIGAHIAWLCRHYFGGPVDTLVLKEPHPNWLPFLTNALAPDHIIFLKRHPLGIINSYDSANLYTRWQVGDEWKKFCADLSRLAPELVSMAAGLRHPVDRVTLMAHIGNLLFERLEFNGKQMIDYEALCLEPEQNFGEIYSRLGLAWNDGAWSQLQKLIEPAGDQQQDGFIKVRKRSYERAYAWRRELAPHLVRRVQRLLARLRTGDPLVGDGLPPLTPQEKRQGWRSYAVRRRAYLKHFGVHAMLNSL